MNTPDLSIPERILILKPSSLGDVVSAMPVLAGLKRTFPHARIAWMVTPGCAPILEGQAGLDEIILFDRRRFGRIGRNLGPTRDFITFCRNLRRRQFDWVIDLQGLFRSGFFARVTGADVRAGFADAREFAGIFYTHPISVQAKHTVARNIALVRELGIDADENDLTLTVTQEANAFVESFIAEHNLATGQYLVIAPGTRWVTKLYPRRHWRKVVAELSRDVPIVLTGSDDEGELCDDLTNGSERVFNLAGRTTLPQVAALIASAGAVVCCDSSANFIAPAVGTPFVTLIGPTRPERTGPPGPMGKAIVADIPCQGCLKRRCRHNTCMQLIDPEQVIAETQNAFSRRR